MSTNELVKKWSYELRDWLEKLGSVPVEVIKTADHSESYEMDRKHLWKLESGQYALIEESGCSCYDYADAAIELFPNLKRAKEGWNKAVTKYDWQQEWFKEKF